MKRPSLLLLAVACMMARCKGNISPEPENLVYFDCVSSIYGVDGPKVLTEVKPGDYVLSTNGYVEVKEVGKVKSENNVKFVRLTIYKARSKDKFEAIIPEDVLICRVIRKRILRKIEGLEWAPAKDISEGDEILVYSHENARSKEKLTETIELPFYTTTGLVRKTSEVRNKPVIGISLYSSEGVFVNSVLVRF